MSEECFDLIVVGAGISGITFSKAVKKKGFEPLVLEKSRGTGGRLSSKRLGSAELDAEGCEISLPKTVTFDLGCSAFSAENALLRAQLQKLKSEGVLREWDGTGKFAGVPRASAFTRQMAKDLDMRFALRVTSISGKKGQWRVKAKDSEDEEHLFYSKQVVLATPPAQAATILPVDNEWDAWREKLESVQMLPTWVVMLVVPKSRKFEQLFDASPLLEFGDGAIARASRELTKPEREPLDGLEILVLTMSNSWSQARVKLEHNEVISLAKEAFRSQSGISVTEAPGYAHRWLYAELADDTRLSEACLHEDGIGICGDYFNSGAHHAVDFSSRLHGLDAAYTSALDLAEKFMKPSDTNP